VRRLNSESRAAPSRLLRPDIIRADLDLGARPGTTDSGASALSHVIYHASSARSARTVGRRGGLRA
jgi:hypothetical protein